MRDLIKHVRYRRKELSSDRKAEDTGKESDDHENIQVERFV